MSGAVHSFFERVERGRRAVVAAHAVLIGLGGAAALAAAAEHSGLDAFRLESLGLALLAACAGAASYVAEERRDSLRLVRELDRMEAKHQALLTAYEREQAGTAGPLEGLLTQRALGGLHPRRALERLSPSPVLAIAVPLLCSAAWLFVRDQRQARLRPAEAEQLFSAVHRALGSALDDLTSGEDAQQHADLSTQLRLLDLRAKSLRDSAKQRQAGVQAAELQSQAQELAQALDRSLYQLDPRHPALADLERARAAALAARDVLLPELEVEREVRPQSSPTEPGSSGSNSAGIQSGSLPGEALPSPALSIEPMPGSGPQQGSPVGPPAPSEPAGGVGSLRIDPADAGLVQAWIEAERKRLAASPTRP